LRSYLEKHMNRSQIDEALRLSQQFRPQITAIPESAP
jgi:hypothetical protein